MLSAGSAIYCQHKWYHIILCHVLSVLWEALNVVHSEVHSVSLNFLCGSGSVPQQTLCRCLPSTQCRPICVFLNTEPHIVTPFHAGIMADDLFLSCLSCCCRCYYYYYCRCRHSDAVAVDGWTQIRREMQWENAASQKMPRSFLPTSAFSPGAGTDITNNPGYTCTCGGTTKYSKMAFVSRRPLETHLLWNIGEWTYREGLLLVDKRNEHGRGPIFRSVTGFQQRRPGVRWIYVTNVLSKCGHLANLPPEFVKFVHQSFTIISNDGNNLSTSLYTSRGPPAVT